MSLTEKVSEFLATRDLIHADERVVVGFSGGPDSTCLLLILRELLADIAAVYINHNLRGDESQREEEFVRAFCEQRKIPLFVEALQWTSIPGNLEDAARRKRYRHYSKVAAENHFDRVALGHQQDDVAETFLLRLIRGTGPRGLAGIAAKRGIYVRPLLQCSREEILEFLREKRIPFFSDSSNARLDFQRNRIRNELIPYIRKNFNAVFPEPLFRAIHWIAEQNDLIEELLLPFQKMIHATAEGIWLYRKEFTGSSGPLRKAILRIALQEADPTLQISSRILAVVLCAIEQRQRIELPGFLEVRTDEERIQFSVKKNPGNIEVDVPAEGEYFFPPGNCSLQFRTAKDIAIGQSHDSAVIDFEKACFPLYIRNARRGDRFQPLGMRGHKKLSDFFIDRKIPRPVRKSIPLVFKNDELVWVGGQQLNEKYRVTSQTKTFLQIELKRNV
jgi:tRNA(Ile)-lysidine synthase